MKKSPDRPFRRREPYLLSKFLIGNAGLLLAVSSIEENLTATKVFVAVIFLAIIVSTVRPLNALVEKKTDIASARQLTPLVDQTAADKAA